VKKLVQQSWEDDSIDMGGYVVTILERNAKDAKAANIEGPRRRPRM
jgi:hypothetical protein